jgi:hypothetical protein
LLVLLGACVDTPPEPVPFSLSAFPGFTLDVTANSNGVGVQLTILDEYAETCPALLPSFVATLDEVPMMILQARVDDVGLDFPEYECTVPSVHTSAGGRYMHVADASATFDIDLGEATVERTMQVSTADVVRGGTFDVSWMPATDLAAGTQYVYLKSDLPDRLLDYTVDGGTLHVVMPAALDFLETGRGELVVGVTHAPACPYTPCHIETRNHLTQEVTVH